MGFEDLQKALAPAWLRAPNGQKWCGFSGTEKDVQILLLKDGIKARWITIGPDDALFDQGLDSDLERYAGETDDGYRTRLLGRWETWKFAGTEKGVVDALNVYGIADVELYEDWEGHFTLGGDLYSRVWMVIGPDMPWVPLTMPFVLGSPTTLGSTATINEVVAVKRQLLKWKSAHSYPVKIILHFPGVILLGINSVMPFTPPVAGSPYATWTVGKLIQDTVSATPFVLGGYEV